MDPYRLVLFCHVLAAVGLFVALAVEGLGLRHLRASTSYEQAREWLQPFKMLLPLGMPATLVALSSGIYLATTMSAWELGWVKLAVPTLVVVAIVGAIVGPRRARLSAAVAKGAGPLTADLVAQLRHPLPLASWRICENPFFGRRFTSDSRKPRETRRSTQHGATRRNGG
jgi:hypothetical protein